MDHQTANAKLGLQYETLNELTTSHGRAIVADTLLRTGLLDDGLPANADLMAEVRDHVSPGIIAMIERRVAEAGPAQRSALLAAIVVDLFEEPFGDIWLAAMAQHADAEGKEFAFGYLVAQLDLKRSSEADFLRGRGTLRSASKGGVARSRHGAHKRNEVLAAMRQLQQVGGHGVARSAQLAAERGIGISKGANVRLWYRHAKK